MKTVTHIRLVLLLPVNDFQYRSVDWLLHEFNNDLLQVESIEGSVIIFTLRGKCNYFYSCYTAWQSDITSSFVDVTN